MAPAPKYVQEEETALLVPVFVLRVRLIVGQGVVRTFWGMPLIAVVVMRRV